METLMLFKIECNEKEFALLVKFKNGQLSNNNIGNFDENKIIGF